MRKYANTIPDRSVIKRLESTNDKVVKLTTGEGGDAKEYPQLQIVVTKLLPDINMKGEIYFIVLFYLCS